MVMVASSKGSSRVGGSLEWHVWSVHLPQVAKKSRLSAGALLRVSSLKNGRCV